MSRRSRCTPLAACGMALLVACGKGQEAPLPRAISAPAGYEGKIVHQPPTNGGKKDGWFLVQNGQRRWISNAAWLEKNSYTPAMVVQISAAEFNALHEDPRSLD